MTALDALRDNGQIASMPQNEAFFTAVTNAARKKFGDTFLRSIGDTKQEFKTPAAKVMHEFINWVQPQNDGSLKVAVHFTPTSSPANIDYWERTVVIPKQNIEADLRQPQSYVRVLTEYVRYAFNQILFQIQFHWKMIQDLRTEHLQQDTPPDQNEKSSQQKWANRLPPHWKL